MKRIFLFGSILIISAFSLVGARALTLSRAEMANPEIRRFIRLTKYEHRDWADTLLKYMPTSDLVSLDADSMLAALDALDSVLSRVPWANDVPKNFFYHYVLPYRVSQEALEYFRKNHWRELWERVKDCRDMRCAVYRLNEWAYEEMKYEPSSRWDQTAEQTLVRGIGRCEEMAILFIKACRAMAIPARDAYTPYWPFTNSNHAWVEVWTGDKWHFVGGAEMTPLDNAWFDKASKRATIIKSIIFGETDSADAPIYYSKNGFTILNTTPNYSDTTGVNIFVGDSSGAPAESADVWISVFNYSSLRAVAHHYTDENGHAHFILGKSAAFLSAGKDSFWNYSLLSFTDGDTSISVKMSLTRKTIPDTMFWLHNRHDVEAEKDTSYKAPKISKVRHNLKQERLTALSKDLLAHLPDSSDSKRFLKCMNRARGNRKQCLKFWDAHPDEHESILSFWEAMSDKDILLPDSSLWETLWSQVSKMRQRADTTLPDSLFWNDVANPRILWENFGNWYPIVRRKVARYDGLSADKIAELLRKNVVERLDTLTDKDYFGGMMNPMQTLAAGTGGKIERLAVFVAAMRVLGIPARIGWDYSSAEYFADNKWQRFEIGENSESEKRENGTVKTFFRDDTIRTDLEYYDDFCIAKLSDGMFDDITPPKDTSGTAIIFKNIPAGEYAFITGLRNGFGDPFVRVKPFTVSAGTTAVNVKIGLPPQEFIHPGDLVARKFSKLNIENIRDTHRKPLTDSDWQRGTVIVALFDTEHENSISTARKLADVKNIPMLLFIETSSSASAKRFCRQNNLSGRIFFGERKKLKTILKFRKLPSILLLQDGKAILWTEGLNLNIDKLIENLAK